MHEGPNFFTLFSHEELLYLQNLASIFLIFAWGLSYDLSKFSDDLTPYFRL